MRRPIRRTLAALLPLCLGAVACDAREAEPPADASEQSLRPGPEGFYGTVLPEPRVRPTIRLVDAEGQPFDLGAERERVVLLFLGYTQCPDFCPATLARWKRVRQALGADTARVRFVFVSVDPERDTPEAAAAYARRFDPSFVGLTGRRREIVAIERQFGVTSFAEVKAGGTPHAHGGHAHDATDSARQAAGADTAGHISSGAGTYTIAHPSRVFVIDRGGAWRLVMPAEAGTRATTADVRRLLRG